jgi:hypothetical protein
MSSKEKGGVQEVMLCEYTKEAVTAGLLAALEQHKFIVLLKGMRVVSTGHRERWSGLSCVAFGLNFGPVSGVQDIGVRAWLGRGGEVR